MGTEKEGLTEAEFNALHAALDADLKRAQQMYAERGVYPTMELRVAIEVWRLPEVLARANALVAENARLREERRDLHDALLTLMSHINMRAHPSDRAKWVCPYCKGTHKSLTALEEGEGHAENCPYAAARHALEDSPEGAKRNDIQRTD